jgi:UrcA family protein
MKTHLVAISTLSALAMAAGLSPALAQKGDPVQTGAAQEQITVVGPRIMRSQVRGVPEATHGMGYYDLLTMTRQVSYADLNIARSEDERMLEKRIDQAADEICKELASTPPADLSSAQYCTQRAITSAMDDVHAAMARAKR